MDDLLAAASDLLTAGGRRRLLGVAGPPGSGKSTLAQSVVDGLLAAHGPVVGLVGMDAFHLPDEVLTRLGRRQRKGAPDTFDTEGYVALLRRLRDDPGPVAAPVFDRVTDEPVPAALVVGSSVRLVVTEGNYLLHDADGWGAVRGLLDACWYVEVDDEVRLNRLIARHVRYGKSEADARAWAHGSDETNARVVRASRRHADRVVRPGPG